MNVQFSSRRAATVSDGISLVILTMQLGEFVNELFMVALRGSKKVFSAELHFSWCGYFQRHSFRSKCWPSPFDHNLLFDGHW